MSFKYYGNNPSPPISACAVMNEQFQALLSEQFEVASDYYVIKEESSFASGSYVNVGVRINRGINVYTGEKLGDDFKLVLFKELNHPIDFGRFYYFDNNYWLTYNTEKIKNLVASCMVRRCNNVLRWYDTDGVYHQEYCILDYQIKRPVDSVGTANPVTPGGFIHIYTQLNSKTHTIKDGQRFIFGNTGHWTAYKVFGAGVKNFQNITTSDNNSAKMLTLEVGTSYINEDTDDIILGIADKYKYTTSASSVNNIVIVPNSGDILQSGSQIFDVRYYSGSVVLSGSFVFTINDNNVPIDHYTFATLSNNTFSVVNNEKYLDYPLSILCAGSSGSRIFEVNLKGDW